MTTGTSTTEAGKGENHAVLKQRLLAVAGGTLAALAVFGAATSVFGLDLRIPVFSSGQQPQELNAAIVAVTGVVGGLAAWGVLALLERFSTKPERLWVVIAPVALLVSIVGGPVSGLGITTGNRIALIAMHLAVGAVVIPFFYRRSVS